MAWHQWQATLLFFCVSSMLMMQRPGIRAYTDPEEFNRLIALRDRLLARGGKWQEALETWTCPTQNVSNSDSDCDPCGRSYDGNWAHMHCRGNSRGWGESGDGAQTGLVTNLHVTDIQVGGPIPEEVCTLSHLREFDLDGSMHTGPIPDWLARCFPDLEELDLSFNRLTGTLPEYLTTMPRLTEVKAENNSLTGTIAPAFGSMNLRRFQVEINKMTGIIPQTFRNVRESLTQLHLAENDFEGDMSALAGSHLATVTVHNNPRLCGMVPSSVRYAVYYNPANTRLGLPCTTAPAAPSLPAVVQPPVVSTIFG